MLGLNTEIKTAVDLGDMGMLSDTISLNSSKLKSIIDRNSSDRVARDPKRAG